MKVRSTLLSKAGKLLSFLWIWGWISFETLEKMIIFCMIDDLALLESLCITQICISNFFIEFCTLVDIIRSAFKSKIWSKVVPYSPWKFPFVPVLDSIQLIEILSDVPITVIISIFWRRGGGGEGADFSIAHSFCSRNVRENEFLYIKNSYIT